MTTYVTPAEVGVEVGSIFHSSWGYDQTNADFYEVVALTPKAVRVKPISKRLAEDGSGVVPVPGSFGSSWRTKDAEKGDLKRLQSYEFRGEKKVSFTVASYASASLWDGKPKYDTIALGYPGH
jgi:hypothetical protein